MTLRRSSGSSRAPSIVELTRSTNITVSCRRSAPCWRGFGAADPFCSGNLVASATPHAAQNFLPGEFLLLQTLQVSGSGEPQSPQKLSLLPTSAPQRGQAVRSCSMVAVVTCSVLTVRETYAAAKLVRRYRHLLQRNCATLADRNMAGCTCPRLTQSAHSRKGHRCARHRPSGSDYAYIRDGAKRCLAGPVM
jgi:hypothetical protein